MNERLGGLIDPFDATRIKSCAYELSMGNEAYITDSRKLRSRMRLRLRSGQHVIIPPGQLAQLLVKETVTIPQDSLGFLSMKSSFKIRGLVNVSGFHVDPGCPRAPTSTWAQCASPSSKTTSTPCPASSTTGTQPTASMLPSVATTSRACPGTPLTHTLELVKAYLKSQAINT